jgi:DNA-directed DNA polymerase III PolC
VFVHLHCHSHYSFLRAVPSPGEIVAAAAEQKMSAVALTDTAGLYAAVPFYEAARAAGVRPILGAVLDVRLRTDAENRWKKNATTTGGLCRPSGARVSFADPTQGFRPGLDCAAPPGLARSAPFSNRGTKSATTCLPAGKATNRAASLVLLAADNAGYSNLCALVTQRQLSEAPLTPEDLAACAAGLIALASPATYAGTQSCGASDLAALKEIFGDALYLEVQHLSPGDGRALRRAEQIGRTLGARLVATNNVHFLRAEEHLHHRVLNAIRTGSLLTTVGVPRHAGAAAEITMPEAWFKPADEMQRAFPDHPELLRATLEIAERCQVELELGKTILPEFPVPENETPFSYLWKLCFDGARRIYRPLRPEVLSRLTHELEVIETLGLAPYFLLVWDIVEEARRRGIPAVARGSAASSMVTYCLGISRICPLRWGLYFERFLNRERGDIPDIDLDICGARRDELIEYVYTRWGESHVAMIGSFITMHARLAIREVAKVFGLPPGEVNHFTRRLPHRPVREILEAIRTLPQCRSLPAGEEPWKTILEVARRLDDFPRHLGIHPCGTVIAARPLTELVPLERATKGIVVTQYDMNAIEALGLIKMDLLGQRGLTTMTLALDGIARATGTRPDFDAIPENDPAACAMISRGRTMGIFQIESPGMRGLLRTLGAHTLEEISLALALIRPGASEYGSKESFLKRLRGAEPIEYAHAALEPILRESLGVCVYQEQVMQISQAIGQMSLAEADLVRRSSRKFSGPREREHLRAKFLKAAAQMGLAGKNLEATWQMVEKFAGFGFCKAHAATYADLSYRIAYLKAHHPAEFLAAMASSGAGFYHVSAYVEEAKRWGIPVRLPSVNDSRLEYLTEPADEAGAVRAIRVGLMQIRGLRTETIEQIIASRKERGAYGSLEDCLARVRFEQDEVEALIKCGAFDCLRDAAHPEWTRPALLWQWSLLCARMNSAAAHGTSGADEAALFPYAAPPQVALLQTEAPPLADYSRAQRLACEQEILEICVSGHPLDRVARNGETWSTDLPALRAGNVRARRVTLLGWLVTFRPVGTKTGRNMMFLTLEDQRGLFEAILFPDDYERYAAVVFETRLLRVSGRIENDEQIRCDRVERAIP